MGAPPGTAQLVEHQVARNFQEPGGEFGAGDITASALPDTNKNLLCDIFDVRVAAQHARYGARHQSLMLVDELLECAGIALTHQPHQPHVVSVFFRSPCISWILSSHRSVKRLLRCLSRLRCCRLHRSSVAARLRECGSLVPYGRSLLTLRACPFQFFSSLLDARIRENLPEKWHSTKIRHFVTFVAMVFVASRKRPVHAWAAEGLRSTMNYQLIPKELRPIAERVEAQQRISEADALTLYRA